LVHPFSSPLAPQFVPEREEREKRGRKSGDFGTNSECYSLTISRTPLFVQVRYRREEINPHFYPFERQEINPHFCPFGPSLFVQLRYRRDRERK